MQGQASGPPLAFTPCIYTSKMSSVFTIAPFPLLSNLQIILIPLVTDLAVSTEAR